MKCEGVSIGNASHLRIHKMLILSLSKIRYIVLVGPQSVKKFCEYDAYIRFPELFLVKKDTITILTTRPSSIAEI